MDVKTGRPPLIDAEIRAFRSTVARDQYSLESFLPWSELDIALADLYPGVARLQDLVDRGDTKVSSLTSALLEEPILMRVFQRLLSAPSGIGFGDGRELPSDSPRNVKQARGIARLLIDLGVWTLVPPDAEVLDLVRVALVASDSRRRVFRRSGTIQQRVRQLVGAAIDQVVEETGAPLALLRPSDFPQAARGRAAFLVGLDGRPVAAVNSVFQAASGGRQQRDLLVTYPNLQADLDSVPAHLILIVDGFGIAETPDRILETLFASVAACMTVRQAEGGQLVEALTSAATNVGLRGRTRAPLDRLVSAALEDGGELTVDQLPASMDAGRLALARYATEHPELALVLAPGGDSLRWSRADFVNRASVLHRNFDTRAATSLLRALLEGPAAILVRQDEGLFASVIQLRPDLSLPETILAVATDLPADSDTLRRVASLSLTTAPESKMSVVLAPEREVGFTEAEQRRLQGLLPVNVIVVEPSDLLLMAKSSRPPRVAFAELVLRQSDLIKASPFIVTSATPERMFYGREAEQASIIATVASNSVALLGSRRIGKTSLLRHTETQLKAAGFAPYFMDCQTVRNWEDFGALASERWDVSLPQAFKPRSVLALAGELARRQDGGVVFLLDEIDQLLDWDQHHTEEEVPEAFFRACRTLSQDRAAQFVFSGERTIARKLWDPHSPHWNFCRPLAVQQLTKEAAEHLLLDPLTSLQIAFENEAVVLDELWRVTSGHPQLVQLIGDSLVRLLDVRESAERSVLGISDLNAVTQTYDFSETYLETYWGQATPFERLLSVWVSIGVGRPADVVAHASKMGIAATMNSVSDALRMLTLYGIVHSDNDGYALRAELFPEALQAYGGREQLESQFIGAVS